MPQLIDVSHVSKRGSSLRITIPKRIAMELNLEGEDLVGFYLEGDVIVISRLK